MQAWAGYTAGNVLPRQLWEPSGETVDQRAREHPYADKRPFRYIANMTQVNIFDRITVEPAKCGGKPCIRGLRITVRRVLELLADHPHREDILQEYPFLEEEDLQQALRYAAHRTMTQ